MTAAAAAAAVLSVRPSRSTEKARSKAAADAASKQPWITKETSIFTFIFAVFNASAREGALVRTPPRYPISQFARQARL